MLPQALDFRDESDALFALLDTLDDSDWARETQFKYWTPNDIVAHRIDARFLLPGQCRLPQVNCYPA
jgi:hypothetical protein